MNRIQQEAEDSLAECLECGEVLTTANAIKYSEFHSQPYCDRCYEIIDQAPDSLAD